MKLSEFAKAPPSTYLFDYWVHPVSAPSPLGKFEVELMPSAGEPDAQMLDEAERIVSFVKAYPWKVVEKVFEHYTRLLAHPDWLASCGVPLNLTVKNLSPYLQSRSISVNRERVPEGFLYEGQIYISPQWDSEHAIYLEVNDMEVEFCDV